MAYIDYESLIILPSGKIVKTKEGVKAGYNTIRAYKKGIYVYGEGKVVGVESPDLYVYDSTTQVTIPNISIETKKVKNAMFFSYQDYNRIEGGVLYIGITAYLDITPKMIKKFKKWVLSLVLTVNQEKILNEILKNLK